MKDFLVTAAAVFVGALLAGIATQLANKYVFKNSYEQALEEALKS